MKTWQKLALIVLPAILILGIGIWRIQVARNRPGVAPQQAEERHLSDEEMVQPRKLYIDDLKSARDLIGKKIKTTQKVPADLATRIPRGTSQAFAVFTMPGDPKEFATAIGTIQGTDSTYYCDNVFYYDDPHQMYKFWPADVWQAVDRHQPKAGMTELEVAMALGVMQRSDSSNYGNRTVDYDAGGKHWEVTFENDKATQVQQ